MVVHVVRQDVQHRLQYRCILDPVIVDFRDMAVWQARDMPECRSCNREMHSPNIDLSAYLLLPQSVCGTSEPVNIQIRKVKH